jgi:sugar phosphate isomerase/epimerase
MAYPATMKGDGPVLETVSAVAADSFFGAIEIRRPSDMTVREKLKKILDVSGIKVIMAGQPPLLMGKHNLNSENLEERNKAIEDVKKTIDDAVFFNADKVIILSGPHPGEEKKKVQTDLLIESLKTLSKYAAEKNKLFSLEVFDDKIDKKCLIGPAKESVEMAAAVADEFPNFGLTVDLSHIPLLNENSGATLETVKKYLNHVHVGSCYMADKTSPAYGDQHPRFSLKGSINNEESLADFLRNLFLIGYLKNKPSANPPIVSFEVKPLPEEQPELVIADAKRVWQKAWALV